MASMMDVLECEVCLDQFDSSTRKPKLLSCGHTICLLCVVELHRKAAASQPVDSFLCPKCRRETRSSPNALIDNFYILSMLQDVPKEKPRPMPVRFWCLECNEVADQACEEKHTICRLQKHRGRELKDAVDLLEKAVAVRRRLTETLRDMDQKLNGVLGKEADKFAKSQENTQASLSLLYDSLELVGSEWDEASATIEEARQACVDRLPVDEQSLDFLRSARRCEVTVHDGEGGSWCGDVDLQQDKDGEAATVLFALLCTMQRTEILKKRPRQQDESEAAVVVNDCSKESGQVTKQEQSEKQQTEVPQAPGTGNGRKLENLSSKLLTSAAPIESKRDTPRPQQSIEDEAFWDALEDETVEASEEEDDVAIETEFARSGHTLDVTFLSRSTGKRTEKDTLLLNSNMTVNSLRGLECGVDRAWACALLGVLSRQLEVLQMADAHEEHLHAVTAMPRLRQLSLRSRAPIASAFNGCSMPGPAQLQHLELDVPLSDVPTIFRLCGGGVPRLRLALPDDTDPGTLRSLVTGLREADLQRRALQQWSVSAGPSSQRSSPLGLSRVDLMQRRDRGSQRRLGHPPHKVCCAAQLQVFTAGLPGVHVHCVRCAARAPAAPAPGPASKAWLPLIRKSLI